MAVTGMNLTEVQHLGEELRGKAEQLRAIVSDVDGRVANTTWVGRDADTFKHQWWPGHRQRLLDAAAHIHGLGQSAANNVTEQEHASSRYGGSAAGVSHSSNPVSVPMPAHTSAPVQPAPSHDSAAATSAVLWAQGHLDSRAYDGGCLGFVSDAWGKGGDYWHHLDDPGAYKGSDTYPADIWGHLTGGTKGPSSDLNPPAGAWVFYSGYQGDRTLSHVTLSVGDGQAISTYDNFDGTPHHEIHPEPVDSRGGRYLGWWLPPS